LMSTSGGYRGRRGSAAFSHTPDNPRGHPARRPAARAGLSVSVLPQDPTGVFGQHPDTP